MLIALLIILLLLLAIVLFILFTTLHIYVDSRQELYFVRLWGLFKLTLDPNEHYQPKLITPVRTFDLGSMKDSKPGGPKRKKRKSRKEKSGKGRSWQSVLTLIRSSFGSFKVEQFRVDLDTGDCISNAWLVPVFHLASQKGAVLTVNYSGETEVVFSAKNRLIRLLLPLIRFFMTKKQKP